MKVRKVHLSIELVAHLLNPALAEIVPDDAVIANVWMNNDGTVGLLIKSDEYSDIEAGDVVSFAPLIEPKQADIKGKK